MKIIVFSERFWPENGGGELAMYFSFLKLLATTGDFKVEVYTGTERPIRIPSVSIRTVRFLRTINKVQLLLNILRNRRYIEKAIEKADVVYI